MASHSATPIRLSRVATTLALLGFAAIGLLAGILTHALTSSQSPSAPGNGPVISGSPPALSATMTPATADATATSTISNQQSGFTLGITLSQRTVTVGETLTVTVVATTNGAPVSGLSCTLRAPTDGPPGLLATWPAAATTDANGQAIWTITVPSLAPGTYGVEVDAIGAHRYEFHRYASIQVS